MKQAATSNISNITLLKPSNVTCLGSVGSPLPDLGVPLQFSQGWVRCLEDHDGHGMEMEPSSVSTLMLAQVRERLCT